MSISGSNLSSPRTSKWILIVLACISVMSTLYVYDELLLSAFDSYESVTSRILRRKRRKSKTPKVKKTKAPKVPKTKKPKATKAPKAPKAKKAAPTAPTVPTVPRESINLLIGFPGSGADYLHESVEKYVGYQLGTNKPKEDQKSVSVQQEWYPDGPFFTGNSEYPIDGSGRKNSGHLVLTDCSYCDATDESCTGEKYFSKDYGKFEKECLRTHKYDPTKRRRARYSTSTTPYLRNMLGTSFVVTRDPMEIIGDAYMRAHGGNYYPYTEWGDIVDWCKKIDEKGMEQSEMRGVVSRFLEHSDIPPPPCYTEHIRITTFYNNAYQLADVDWHTSHPRFNNWEPVGGLSGWDGCPAEYVESRLLTCGGKKKRELGDVTEALVIHAGGVVEETWRCGLLDTDNFPRENLRESCVVPDDYRHQVKYFMHTYMELTGGYKLSHGKPVYKQGLEGWYNNGWILDKLYNIWKE